MPCHTDRVVHSLCFRETSIDVERLLAVKQGALTWCYRIETASCILQCDHTSLVSL